VPGAPPARAPLPPAAALTPSSSLPVRCPKRPRDDGRGGAVAASGAPWHVVATGVAVAGEAKAAPVPTDPPSAEAGVAAARSWLTERLGRRRGAGTSPGGWLGPGGICGG